MLKSFFALLMGFALIPALPAISQPAPTPTINFAVDCMIHDAKGNMLQDLGQVGMMKDGYQSVGDFSFTAGSGVAYDVEANLSGPFPQTPEVTIPQIKLSVVDKKGVAIASAVLTLNDSISAALLIPNENLYLHCDKMEATQLKH